MRSDVDGIRTIVTTPADRLDAEQVLSALVMLRQLRGQLAEWEPQLIGVARALGTSWVAERTRRIRDDTRARRHSARERADVGGRFP